MTKRLGENLRAMLDQAAAALEADEAGDAERRAKAITALVRAERDVAEFVADERARAPEEDEEQLRAELRHRLARFVEAARADAPAEVLERIATQASAQ